VLSCSVLLSHTCAHRRRPYVSELKERYAVAAVYNEKMEILISDLDNMGFYRHADRDDVENIKRESLKNLDVFVDYYICDQRVSGEIIPDATNRAIFVDAEDIYENGPKLLLRVMAELLRQRGVTIHDVNRQWSDRGHELRINDCVTERDIESQDIRKWMVLLNQVLATLNVLLEMANSEERLFYRYSDNDTQIMFLTQAMCDAITISGAMSSADIPRCPDPIPWKWVYES
jgi:hypothetical protein